MKKPTPRRNRPWQAKPRKPLPEEEWNFARVPCDELPICVWYEYARSAEDFKKRVLEWRKRHSLDVFAFARRLRDIIIQNAPASTPEPQRAIAATWIPYCLAASRYNGLGANDIWSPDGLRALDYRHTCYFFPDFPDSPWQRIAPLLRAGFPLFSPNLNAVAVRPAMARLFPVAIHSPTDDASTIKTRLQKQDPNMMFIPDSGLVPLPANAAIQPPGIEEEKAAQRKIQGMANAPVSEQQLTQMAQQHMNAFIFVPPLRELHAGKDFGVIPTSFCLKKAGKQVWAGGYCHEKAHFVVNWAKPNSDIETAFKEWIKKHRPCDEFRHWNATRLREHLKKLGAWRILTSGVSANQAANWYELYATPKDWLRAKSEAQRLMAELVP